MNLKINPEKLHHAYFLQGETETVLPNLLSFLEQELSIVSHGNPDMRIEIYETFGVDEGRGLKDAQLGKSFSGGRKIFIISFETVTVEAQNSLLKVFEDPTPDTHFFLISRSGSRLLPTLRSRIEFVEVEQGGEKDFSKAKQFVSSSIHGRLKFVEKIAEDKNKKEAKELLEGVIHVFKNNYSHAPLLKEEGYILSEMMRAHGYLSDRSPSIKMLLEHVAHILPVEGAH